MACHTGVVPATGTRCQLATREIHQKRNEPKTNVRVRALAAVYAAWKVANGATAIAVNLEKCIDKLVERQ